MSLSSVCVCLNALRLRGFDKKTRRQRSGEAEKGSVNAAGRIPETKDNRKMKRIRLGISGMMCEHCEAAVSEILASFGAEEIRVSHELGEAEFDLENTAVKDQILEAIRAEDYEPGEWSELTDIA